MLGVGAQWELTSLRTRKGEEMDFRGSQKAALGSGPAMPTVVFLPSEPWASVCLCVLLRHQVCGNLRQQPQGVSTVDRLPRRESPGAQQHVHAAALTCEVQVGVQLRLLNRGPSAPSCPSHR